MKWEEEEEAFREECAAKGIETERARALNISADVADRLDLKRSKRQANQDQGFSSYSDASHRKYLKQIRQLNIDRVAYQKQKERLNC
ncbi:unnamed protein product [Protopolystoma xenopodis]|uniref:Pre-mRNA-splicing factor SYF2 n=1 Tax=Protopolystoma xenopodis TaxID=117903 RepID=A0A3S5C1C4_9PLAT|nr:unnamed protein product [Protopolystoma xenopodis]